MQNKADYNMNEKYVDSVCQMLSDYLPAGNRATDSHYEAEKLMQNFGIPYYIIDVCINNYMIFLERKLGKCQFCCAEKWKPREKRRRTKYNIVVCGIYISLIG